MKLYKKIGLVFGGLIALGTTATLIYKHSKKSSKSKAESDEIENEELRTEAAKSGSASSTPSKGGVLANKISSIKTSASMAVEHEGVRGAIKQVTGGKSQPDPEPEAKTIWVDGKSYTQSEIVKEYYKVKDAANVLINMAYDRLKIKGVTRPEIESFASTGNPSPSVASVLSSFTMTTEKGLLNSAKKAQANVVRLRQFVPSDESNRTTGGKSGSNFTGLSNYTGNI